MIQKDAGFFQSTVVKRVKLLLEQKSIFLDDSKQSAKNTINYITVGNAILCKTTSTTC